jgi:chromate transport protein ChrA
VAAVLAVTLPAAILVLWLTHLYALWSENIFAKAAIAGTLAAAVGMMAAGAWLLVRSHTARGETARSLIIVAGAVLLRTIPLSPIQILALAALIGFFWRKADTI